MIAYALHADADNWHSDVDFVDTVLYHGVAILPRDRNGIASNNANCEPIIPLKLDVNSYQIPDVFLPSRSGNLVVSERVADKLLIRDSTIQIVRATLNRCVSIPWVVGASSDRSDELLNAFYHGPSNPSLANAFPPYYEVCGYHHFNEINKCKKITHVFTSWYEGERDDLDMLPISEEMFSRYSVTDAAFPVVREDIYAILEDHINKKMFGIKSLHF